MSAKEEKRRLSDDILEGKIHPDEVFLKPGVTTNQASTQDPAASNAWRNGEGSGFKVRCGPNYSANKKKDFSLDQMYDVVAVDFFRSSHRIMPVSRIYHLPTLSPATQDFKHDHVPPLIILNIQVPDCPANFLGGGSKDDGQTLQAVFFFEIREDTIRALQNPDNPEWTPSHELFERWCRDCKDDDKLRHRLKMIGFIGNFRELGLPTLIEGYNGKPVIIAKSGNIFRAKDNSFLEICINVHTFPTLTKKLIYSLRGRMKEMMLHIGGTIEARAEEEMPERIVFALHVMKIDGFSTRIIPDDALLWLQRQADELGHNQVEHLKPSS